MVFPGIFQGSSFEIGPRVLVHPFQGIAVIGDLKMPYRAHTFYRVAAGALGVDLRGNHCQSGGLGGADLFNVACIGLASGGLGGAFR